MFIANNPRVITALVRGWGLAGGDVVLKPTPKGRRASGREDSFHATAVIMKHKESERERECETGSSSVASFLCARRTRCR